MDQVAWLLIIGGVILLIIETTLPGGVIGFTGGALIVAGLYRADLLTLTWGIIVLLAFAAGLAAFAVPALRARKGPVTSGAESLIGKRVEAHTDLDPKGTVMAKGTLWNARCTTRAAAGSEVTVTATDGIVLVVEPVEAEGA